LWLRGAKNGVTADFFSFLTYQNKNISIITKVKVKYEDIIDKR